MAAGTVFPGGGAGCRGAREGGRGGGARGGRRLHELGFRIGATSGTASVLATAGVPAEVVKKVSEGSPHVVDALEAGAIALVINTPRPDAQELRDSFSIRRTALERKIPYFTTIAGAVAAAEAIAAMAGGPLGVKAIQTYHAELSRGS